MSLRALTAHLADAEQGVQELLPATLEEVAASHMPQVKVPENAPSNCCRIGYQNALITRFLQPESRSVIKSSVAIYTTLPTA